MQINKVSNIQSQNNSKSVNNNSIGFKGTGFTTVMDYLATNPVWGATAVDVGSMGTPRVIVDTYNRGGGAGFETGFREYSSTANDASVGLYGLAAGAALGGMLSKYGVKNAKRIFASNDSIDVHNAKWIDNNGDVDKYINDYVENLKGFNPDNHRADANGFVRIEDGEIKEAIKNDMKALAENNLSDKERKITEKRLTARLIEATGSETELVLKHGDKTVTSSVQTVTDDFYRMTKALREYGKLENTDKLVKGLKRFGRSRAVLGLGSAMAIGACFQPINVWMTKKRTGSDGFAGMEGREKDNSFKFKLMKAGSAVAMAGIALATLQAKPSQVIDKLLFKGGVPTIDQFKGLYATTICSRMLSARDKDELMETDRKDSLGFLNWLVVGSLVEKGMVAAMEDKNNPILRYNKESHKDGFIYKHFGEKVDRLVHSNVATRKELVSEALVEQGVSLVRKDGKAKKVGEVINDLGKSNAKVTKNLRVKNVAQIINYVYTCAVLGAGIPYMNITLTERAQHKRADKINAAVRTIDNYNFVNAQTLSNASNNKNIA